MSKRKVPRPASPPAAMWWSILLALAALVLGGVIIRDATIELGWYDGSSWLLQRAYGSYRLQPNDSTFVVSVVLVLLGLMFLLVAMTPRKTKAYQMDSVGEVWLTHTGAERLARSAVSDVDGVVDASATARGKKLTVNVTSLSGTASHELSQRARARVQDVMDPVNKKPSVSVRVR